MNKDVSEEILDYLKRIDESINGPQPKKKSAKGTRPLSERVDSVSDRVDRLDKKIGTSRSKQPLARQVDSLAEKFDNLDTKVTDLDTKVTGLDTRVSEVQLGLATLAVSQKAGFDRADQRFSEVDLHFKKVDKRFDVIDVKFKHVDKRFDQVDQKIELARVEIVDLVDRVYDEVAGRVIDLEKVGPGRKGNGGRGSGGGGVPLAS